MAHRKSPARLLKASRVAQFNALSAQNAPLPPDSLPWDELAAIEGAITGRALYDGRLDAGAALSFVSNSRRQLA